MFNKKIENTPVNKKTAKIVIGANFGDEGKGLMTDYFANEAKELGKKCLVVCHNGGSQKGHTVVSPDGYRHVYHHFGSGTMAGADTYLSKSYVLNPIVFRKEFEELKSKGILTKVYVDFDCAVTTPFDMMINQMVEEYRESDKHGSCGLGLFETIERNKLECFKFELYDYTSLGKNGIEMLLYRIATEYMPKRLEELGVKGINFKWVDILNNKREIISNWIDDLKFMIDNTTYMRSFNLSYDHDYFVFECAQGLLLDQNNTEYMPHLTPSNTGILNPMELISSDEFDIEACYVTRTYMTRHGAGRFDSECKKSDINSKIIDLTNVPNQYQDTIRYGYLNLDELKDRIKKDCGSYNVKKSLAVTHCNEYEINMEELLLLFGDYRVYLSDGMTRNDTTISWT